VGFAERADADAAAERVSFLLEKIFGARTSSGEICRFLTGICQIEIYWMKRAVIARDFSANSLKYQRCLMQS
jgi:hypothetical protein